MIFPFSFSLHYFFHHFIVTFGVTINVCAIAVIILKTPKSLKEYSLLLLNTSFIELSSVIAHFIVNARLFLDYTSVFCISDGPCRLVSDGFCSVVAGFMNVNMIHSTSILSLSFWYRMRIVQERGAVGRVRLQSLILLLFFPHIIHIACFVSALTPRELLGPVLDRYYVPGYSRLYGLHGLIDISEYIPAMVMGYLVVFPSFFNTHIVYARQCLVGMLRAKKGIMSVKTRGIHESLAKVLTIQAATSSGIVIIVMVALAITQLFFHRHSEDIEGLEYDVAVLAALVNPALTLYFVRDYREFLQRIASPKSAAKTTQFRSLSIQMHKKSVAKHSSTVSPSCQ